MMKAIIIDDVINITETIQYLIENYCEGVEIVGIANDADKGQELIENLKPDLLFLDIQMPGKSGFDLLNSLHNIQFSIIFITAYDEYAIKAIKFGAIDYLLKPIELTELQSAIKRAKIKSEEKNQEIKNLIHNLQKPNDNSNTIIIQSDKNYDLVKIDDIIRIEADGNYSIIITDSNKRFISSKNLKIFEQYLDKNNFIRTHHAHLVNLSKVVKLSTKINVELILSNGEKIPVSVRKKNELFKHFGKF